MQGGMPEREGRFYRAFGVYLRHQEPCHQERGKERDHSEEVHVAFRIPDSAEQDHGRRQYEDGQKIDGISQRYAGNAQL